MFKTEDFELPLEKQLRLRLINQEIDECHDRDQLKDNLKQCAETLMRYQHLLAVTLKGVIEKDLTEFISKMEAEIKPDDHDT